jgi:hypothetical protein
MSGLSSLTDNISDLLKLDENIKTLNNEQKNLKKQRDILEEKVLEILNKNNLTEKKFRLNDSSIFCTKTSTMPPINPALIDTILSNYVSKPQIELLLQKIDDYRQNNRKENIILKRQSCTKTKNKSFKRIKHI